jgi:DNA adenine methylase Dam
MGGSKMKFKKEELIKSPLNYTGGKFKLLPQILPLFPDDIDTFVDLFAGGLDVSLNVNANKIIANDIITPMIDMYKAFQNSDNVIEYVDNVIQQYNLSKTNQDGYLKLREYYNKNKNPLDLFVLISYCYNNQIRFNSKWGFNRAFGLNRSEFNPSMRENIINTLDKIHNFTFENVNFLDFKFPENSFIYIDPPYLITQADYSIQAKWDETKEVALLNLLDNLRLKFALSNVFKHNGKENIILKEWSKKYNVHYLNYDYNNSNADKKDKSKNSTVEVLITNYHLTN